MSTQAVRTPSPELKTPSRRLLSIDLLRGLTLGFMILVNDNGDEHAAYWPLKHAAWNGLTPTDLIFPTFLLLVGVTIVLSTAKRLQEGANKASLLFHVVRRAVILFLLGLVVNSAPFFHLATMRYYGVLPRIALCYLIVATFYILFPGWRSKVVALVVALVGYWALMRFVPIPGYGVPGRDIPLLDHDANLVAWIDRHIFSAQHLYEGTRDPEGLLSTLPALGTTLIGVLAGLWLRTSRSLVQKARGFLVAGTAGIILGALWNFSFPVNKKMWTSSYVLVAGGISLLLIALFIWIADIRAAKEPSTKTSVWKTFLLVFGTNAISSYVLSEVMDSCLGSIHTHSGVEFLHACYLSIHSVIANAPFASLVYSLCYVGVCWLVIYFVLYRNKIFIKI
jgi:predicted acyltransferase